MSQDTASNSALFCLFARRQARRRQLSQTGHKSVSQEWAGSGWSLRDACSRLDVVESILVVDGAIDGPLGHTIISRNLAGRQTVQARTCLVIERPWVRHCSLPTVAGSKEKQTETGQHAAILWSGTTTARATRGREQCRGTKTTAASFSCPCYDVLRYFVLICVGVNSGVKRFNTNSYFKKSPEDRRRSTLCIVMKCFRRRIAGGALCVM